MSSWTHIVSNIYVDTFKESENIVEFVRGAITQAPKITGSERDVDIFINKLNGYNTFIYCSCRDCDDDLCPESKNDCPSKGYQTCVSISIVGDLRDRTIETTEKEFMAFAEFIKKNFFIDYGVCAIYNDFGNKKIIDLS